MSGFADHARLLIAYNAWANRKLLEALAAVTPADAVRPGGASFDSITGNLRHIVTAQTIWLGRWQGQEPNRRLLDESVEAALPASDAALTRYVAGLTDDDWHRVVKYTDSSGMARSQPLGRLITQVVNHGTLHRGEAGMLLAAAGHSPGDLDFVFFCLERDKKAP